MQNGLVRGRLIAGAFISCIVAASCFVPASQAQSTKPLQKVRMFAATGVLDITYAEFTLPSILGYWKAEGYDVDVQPGGGSLQAIQQIIGGGAEFAAGSGNAMVSANVKAKAQVRIAMPISTSDWALVVDPKGPIQSPKDLKGKTIGVFNLATGGLPWLHALMRENGLDPKDIELVATSMGATPIQALKSGQVHGLLYWGSAVASFENTGLNLRQIRSDEWKTYPDYSVGVMQSLVDKDPEMIIKVSRGIAKALTFISANPTCAIKLHWAAYPASKLSGPDEATIMKWSLNSLEGQMRGITEAYNRFGEGKYWGKFDAAGWNKLIDFMVKTQQIDAPIPASAIEVKIPDLYLKINDYDHAAVVKSAKECKF